MYITSVDDDGEIISVKCKITDDTRHLWIINESRKVYVKKVVAFRMLRDYEIPLYENHKCHFKDVAIALVYHSLIKNDDNLDKNVKGMIGSKLKHLWGNKYKSLKKMKK